MLRAFAILLAVCACVKIDVAQADDHSAFPEVSGAPAGLAAKWQHVRRSLAQDAAQLAGCRADPWLCGDREMRFEAIASSGRVREGRARLGEINRAVNLAIRPASDERRFGVADHWSSPLETIGAGVGDCEDYAILKYLALREAGVARDDLKLLIVHDRATRSDHAVVAAQLDGCWLILDNRSFVLVDLELMRYRLLAQLGPDESTNYAAFDASGADSSSDFM